MTAGSLNSNSLNPVEHLWDVVEKEILMMDVQITNPQRLCDVTMSMWNKVLGECFQHLAEPLS